MRGAANVQSHLDSKLTNKREHGLQEARLGLAQEEEELVAVDEARATAQGEKEGT